MCGGDDHLAWKRPVSSEACRGLRTAGGGLFVVPVLVQCPGLSGMEDTPSDIVTPPVLPVQMPATQTSRDQAAVIPPIVTPVTIIEDPHSLATLPVGFRMPDMRDIRRHDAEMVRFIRVISSENLGGLSTGVSETVFLQWEKAAEMIERPTERDQMSMFLRSLHPRYYSFPDTEGKGVGGSSESYGDVCSADFQHRRPGYHPYARSLQIPRSDFPPLQHRHPHSVQQYPSVHPHTVTVRPSFQFQRPQTSIPRPPPSTLPPRFRAHEFCAYHQMAGHRTDYCASLRHTIQDLIDSGAVSLPISTTDTDLGPDMTADSFPVYSTHAVPPPSGLYHHLVIRVRTLCFESSPYCLFSHDVLSFHLVILLFSWHRVLVCFVSCMCCFRVLDSFSIVTGPRAEIDGMMVMIFSEYIEIRLLQLRFTMSDEITPITLTTLYEMMVDLTRRVERIELILSEHPSSSRGAPGVAMPSLPHLTSSTPVTLGASIHVSPTFMFQQHSSSISLATRHDLRPSFGPSVIQFLRIDFPSSTMSETLFRFERTPEQVFETLQAMGFLAPLAPRALPDPVPPQFRLDLYCAYHQSVGHHTDRCTALRHAIQDIVDSGTFGHPQSDMFPIPTSAQAMHADAPSPAVPDLIDLGD
ncbi:hypothetical protein CK203_009240 [Vitis vinifera]|uniref:Retrotransposon gag domain-containing protein n=1 Tax=Vitis vinifera TaxID=29760 RepID=A0A438K2R1_VITVI|nr:hypothetical protein CK203_009240 [Vitis vinifera]